MADAFTLTIAIITYHRPGSLRHALDSLRQLIAPPSCSLHVLVVDNDSLQSAQPVVEAASQNLPFPIQYCVEPRKGIPHARNKALRAASDIDFLAFLDDDDRADANWIAALLQTAEQYTADVVAGKVEYVFPPEQEHLKALDIFAPRKQKTGDSIDSVWTNNVLLRMSFFRNHNLQFDADFSLIGGSDHHFFALAKTKGAHMVYASQAVVFSNVSQQRASWAWISRRNLRIGATLTLSDIKHHGYWQAIRITGQALRDSLGYFIRISKGFIRGETPAIYPAMILLFMLGRVSGLVKILPKEYRT